jgi:AAA-like domain
MSWDNFLEKIAENYELEEDEREAFLTKFSERNQKKSEMTVAQELNVSLPTVKRRLGEVYKVFARICPELNTDTRGKFEILRAWLKKEYQRDRETGKRLNSPIPSSGGIEESAIASSTEPQEIARDFYIEPPEIHICHRELLKSGCLLRIKAPWKMGKTELMSRVINRASEQEYRTVVVNLRDTTETDLVDLDRFLQWFCSAIAQELSVTQAVEEHWEKSIGNPKNKCKRFFEKYLLSEESPLIVALDEVDRVFPYAQIAGEFLGMLRTRHEDAKTRSIWGKLRQILAYTEDYREIDINQSPFNAGKEIALHDFSYGQVCQLVQQYRLNWSEQQVHQLVNFLGGHPYLVHEAIQQVSQQLVSLDELLETAPTLAGIYGNFLQRYGRRLRQEVTLEKAFHQVLRSNVPVALNQDLINKLYNLGLVRMQDRGVVPRCELYRWYFYAHLGENS